MISAGFFLFCNNKLFSDIDMKESEDIDMDSTQALLDSTLPETPVLVDSYLQDSDEDEIFFGNRSTKESKAPFSKSSR